MFLSKCILRNLKTIPYPITWSLWRTVAFIVSWTMSRTYPISGGNFLASTRNCCSLASVNITFWPLIYWDVWTVNCVWTRCSIFSWATVLKWMTNSWNPLPTLRDNWRQFSLRNVMYQVIINAIFIFKMIAKWMFHSFLLKL